MTKGKNDLINLTAKWIWYPERRYLPNTFVLFRKEFELSNQVDNATGWIFVDSRYKLWVNGHFIQRGPAPFDPRYPEIDPVEFTSLLKPGRNVVAIQAVHLRPETTYLPGQPAVIFEAVIRTRNDSIILQTDQSWRCCRPRSWPSGTYGRWFLRAIQEQFDARHYPWGWQEIDFDDSSWQQAMVHDVPMGRPPICGNYPWYEVTQAWPHIGAAAQTKEDWYLRPRTIPLMKEMDTKPIRLCDAGWVKWTVSAEEYFETANDRVIVEDRSSSPIFEGPSIGSFFLPIKLISIQERAAALTFEYPEEIVGFPYIKVRAPSGTVIELLFKEAKESQWLLLRSHPTLGQWARCICKEDITEFEVFDYEAIRFLQILVRKANSPVEILDVGVKRRFYDWSTHSQFETSDNTINRVLNAAVNTTLNLCQDIIVDNVVRERGQYSGDVDWQKVACYYGFGEYRLPRRMIVEFSHGQNIEGWFMDHWPSFGRMDDLLARHMRVGYWGVIVDHALAYCFGVRDYILFSGDMSLLNEVYPRLVRLNKWFTQQRGRDGLMPVDGYTWHTVYIDHYGFKCQADKVAAYNLWYVGYLRGAMAQLAEWIGDYDYAKQCHQIADEVDKTLRRQYWNDELGLFVDNLPRLKQDGSPRIHDRTIALSLLHGQVLKDCQKPSLDALANVGMSEFEGISHHNPYERDLDKQYPMTYFITPGGKRISLPMGFSYPANAQFRLLALARYGRADVVIKDLRQRWGEMKSVRENNTFSESWNMQPHLEAWCQGISAPLYILMGDILGIRPLKPGFAKFLFHPQIADLLFINATIPTPHGPVMAKITRELDRLNGELYVPKGTQAVLGWNKQELPPGHHKLMKSIDKGRTMSITEDGLTEQIKDIYGH